MESITGAPPKPKGGISKKAIYIGAGVLTIFVLAILVSLHNKAEQDKHPKSKAYASKALQGVVASVGSASSGDEADEELKPVTPGSKNSDNGAVPSFIQNMPSSRTDMIASANGVQPAVVAKAEKKKIEELDKINRAPLLLKDEAKATTKTPSRNRESSNEQKTLEAFAKQQQNAASQRMSPKDVQEMIHRDMADVQQPGTTGGGAVGANVPGVAGLAGVGYGGGGMMPGGMMMPTMAPTNPTPSAATKMQTKWEGQQMDSAGKPGILKSDETVPGTSYFLSAGDIIPAVLSGEIKTSTPGNAAAIVSHDVYNDAPGHENEILIPAGSKLVGTYNSNVQFGQDRIQVVWKEIHLPNGTILPIQGNGLDMAGANGFKDEVDNHYMKMIGGVLLMSLFDTGPMLATPSQSTSQLSGGAAESMMGQSIGMNASTFGMQYTSNLMNVPPTVTIRSGYPFSVELPKTIVFSSYYSVIGEKK